MPVMYGASDKLWSRKSVGENLLFSFSFFARSSTERAASPSRSAGSKLSRAASAFPGSGTCSQGLPRVGPEKPNQPLLRFWGVGKARGGKPGQFPFGNRGLGLDGRLPD